MKSKTKLIIFNIALFIILFLNTFINIFDYWGMVIFLLGINIIFKFLFGFEKDNHRYIKDIILNVIIILLIYFLVYYILGLVVGFVKTSASYSFYKIIKFIIPYVLYIILKEFLRYQMLQKSGKSKYLFLMIFFVFLLFDIINSIDYKAITNANDIFLFFSLTLVPSISSNIVACYISNKVGYKPNIIWQVVFGLYFSLLPIVPDLGIYIDSMIKFLFPLIIGYNVYRFFEKRKIKSFEFKKTNKEFIIILFLNIVVLALSYFSSGIFRYQSIVIASNSMNPKIKVGDVVILDRKIDYSNIKIGDVIAYHYNSMIIIHRVVKIEKVGKDYYYYTKGDNNNVIDNYIVYDDTVLGIVDKKIPFIGFPAVWLNEL